MATPMEQPKIKTEKLLRVRNSRGRSVCVVREVYLREDVPCSSPLCLADCDTSGIPSLLSRNVTHYLIPDSTVASKYLEILEFPEICGIIFTQTVCNIVQHGSGRRLYSRLRNIARDLRRGSAIFHNEFQRYASCPREPGEETESWQLRSTYQSAEWYYNHLIGKMPIVMLTQNNDFIEEHNYKTPNVFVMSVEDYLKGFWPKLTAAHELLESLNASLQETGASDKDYSGYLPLDILESGVKSGRYVQGCLQVNKRNAQLEAFVHRTNSAGVKDDSIYSSDILISGKAARNRAVNGDIIGVELLPRNEWKGRSTALISTDGDGSDERSQPVPTGRVVGIIQRNWRDYVATFSLVKESGQMNKPGRFLVVPYDYRIPKIRIGTRQAEALKDCRIVVRIDSWEADSQYPNGHFVRSLGKIGELETEIAALLVEYGLSTGAFSEGQMNEMPLNTSESPWKMSEEEIAKRRDLRNSHLIFSIDPKGCEDVDDTLSVRHLANGNIELGVHIADVSYFVLPNSLTDLEARSRSTTVYLADRRYDMLPEILSAELCSLISGVDRYAVSVIWELSSQNYEVLSVWYGKTVIRSKYKLYYEMAQGIYDGATDWDILENVPELQNLDTENQEKCIDELRVAVRSLMDISRHLKAKRLQGGALELEGSEVQVRLDDSRQVENLLPKQALEVHETVAECMIFANHWVAKKINHSFPNQALLRHHPLPRQEQFDTLIQCARSKGFDINTQSNRTLANSLDKAADPSDSIVNKLLRTLATMAMSNAQYFSTGSLSKDQFFHYGLALDYYTHFTSPIRRYADIIVHRLLMAAVEKSGSQQLLGNLELDELCQHINNKHRASQNAQRESVQLFQALYFHDRAQDDDACIVDAVIFQLRTNGFLVFVPRYSIKGAVYLKKKTGEVAFVRDSGDVDWTPGSLSQTDGSITVNSTKGLQRYNIFDHVTVRISLTISQAHPSSLSFQLLNNCPYKDQHYTVESSHKTDIVKVVNLKMDEQSTLEDDTDEKLSKLKSQFGQSERSLYTVFESLRTMALYAYDL